MAAAWMAHLGVSCRIVEKRSTRVHCGQADGLNPRSIEIFDSLGFADRFWKECNRLIEIGMWNPGPDGVIRRSDRIPDTIVGLSRYQQSVLHQGRIEQFFLDNIEKFSEGKINVERGVAPESLEVLEEGNHEDPESYPVKVVLRTLSAEEAATPQQVDASRVPDPKGQGKKFIKGDGIFRSNLVSEEDEERAEREARARSGNKAGDIEVVRAKYVIGCDGARSWTRRALGFELQGEATDFIWGVMDIIPITDFRKYFVYLPLFLCDIRCGGTDTGE